MVYSALVIRSSLRLGLLGASLLVGALLLLVLYSGARTRGLESHCRNNLRHLGGLAVRNWNALDPQKTGRAFWQGVREAQYRDVRGKWQAPLPDPFVCPVFGRTTTHLEDAGSIDYRGPKKIGEDLRRHSLVEPLGADRPGNHRSGGFVLRVDGSVEGFPLHLDRISDGGSWAALSGPLQD